MKLLYFLLLTTVCFAQEVDSLYITPNGLNGYAVLKAPGSAEDLYNKSLEYLHLNFKQPDSIIKNKLPGKILRWQGIYINKVEFYQNGSLVGASIQLLMDWRFQEGRVKYEIVDATVLVAGMPIFYKGGAFDSCFYNNRGEPRKRVEDIRIAADDFINKNMKEFENYLNGKTDLDDW
ncbi:hypothetical protein [Leeuwenhoekiella sp. CH_XMU1409-2]|uniref:hypothetical protein n=1 Tax=Leeuwenhoekiella sp. CH_XMU1409-2 TaxID=3107768 RepID=UPI003008B20C